MARTADGAVMIDSPPAWMSVLEVRAFGERAAMSATLPLLRRLPQGDGHHVIVLPGFTAGDDSTRPLRHLLRDLGYASHGWRLGANVGPTPKILDGLAGLLERVHAEGRAPVSLIGWSLGGIYARELARAAPELVRQVVTLGSPIQMIEHDRSSAERMWRALRHLHDRDFRRDVRAAYLPPLAVPTSSIYTKTDGVVSFQASLIRRTPTAENIRVYGSHCGLGYNNAAIYAIADRLGQPAELWRHFSAPLVLKGAFPRPDEFDPTKLPHVD